MAKDPGTGGGGLWKPPPVIPPPVIPPPVIPPVTPPPETDEERRRRLWEEEQQRRREERNYGPLEPNIPPFTPPIDSGGGGGLGVSPGGGTSSVGSRPPEWLPPTYGGGYMGSSVGGNDDILEGLARVLASGYRSFIPARIRQPMEQAGQWFGDAIADDRQRGRDWNLPWNVPDRGVIPRDDWYQRPGTTTPTQFPVLGPTSAQFPVLGPVSTKPVIPAGQQFDTRPPTLMNTHSEVITLPNGEKISKTGTIGALNDMYGADGAAIYDWMIGKMAGNQGITAKDFSTSELMKMGARYATDKKSGGTITTDGSTLLKSSGIITTGGSTLPKFNAETPVPWAGQGYIRPGQSWGEGDWMGGGNFYANPYYPGTAAWRARQIEVDRRLSFGKGGSSGSGFAQPTAGALGVTTPTTPTTPAFTWTPQVWQSNKGIAKFDERDWNTVSSAGRTYVEQFMRAHGWIPTGQYGITGPIEFKYNGAAPQNIWFDTSLFSELPLAVREEIRKLFSQKGWTANRQLIPLPLPTPAPPPVILPTPTR